MIQVNINGQGSFQLDEQTINGQGLDCDVLTVRDNTLHIIRNNKSYTALLVSYNAEEKTMVINVNGRDCELSIKDEYDLLMQQLGINSAAKSVVNNVKAPMPGLIIQVLAEAGQEVAKGDNLLILEAMKMENVIKSPRDGKIKKLHVSLRQAVEKNQILIDFE